ncbi:MAG: hypothetical protein AAB785_00150 [Patescibacteria group bacterium]
MARRAFSTEDVFILIPFIWEEPVVALRGDEILDWTEHQSALTEELPEHQLGRSMEGGNPEMERALRFFYDEICHHERTTSRGYLSVYVTGHPVKRAQLALNGVIVDKDLTGMTPREFVENVLKRRGKS